MGLHDWFLNKEAGTSVADTSITPNDVYKYILEKFNTSIGQLSFAERLVFYHEYIIAFTCCIFTFHGFIYLITCLRQ